MTDPLGEAYRLAEIGREGAGRIWDVARELGLTRTARAAQDRARAEYEAEVAAAVPPEYARYLAYVTGRGH